MRMNAFLFLSLIAVLALVSGCSTERTETHDNDLAHSKSSDHYIPFTPEGVALVRNLCQGQWKSDHDGTMAWLRNHRTPSKKMLDFYDQLFGHAIVSWAYNHLIFQIGDTSHEKPIHILAANQRQIVVQIYDEELKRDVFVISDFDPDSQGYWVYVPQHDLKEHFIHIGATATSDPAKVP